MGLKVDPFLKSIMCHIFVKRGFQDIPSLGHLFTHCWPTIVVERIQLRNYWDKLLSWKSPRERDRYVSW